MKNNIMMGTIILLIIIVFLIVAWGLRSQDRISGECSFNNIEYVNVSPNNCWIGNTANKICPLPKDISCSGDIKAYNLVSILEGVR